MAWNVRVAGSFFFSRVCCGNRFDGPLTRDGARDAFGEPLFAVFPDHARHFRFLCALYPVGGRFADIRVHAHVEEAFRAEAETTLRIVQLRRGDTEIEKNTADAPSKTETVDRACQHGEGSPGNPHARVGTQLAARVLAGLRIAVENQQPTAIAESFQYFLRVPASTVRGIDIHSVILHLQCLQRLLQQYRNVVMFIHAFSLERERFEIRWQLAALLAFALEPFGALCVPRAFVPDFKFVSLTDQHNVFVESREFTQRR